MPSVWRWRPGGQIPPDRRVVHAVVAGWLDKDHHANRKPWSWTYVRDGADIVIDIAVLDDTLVHGLIVATDTYRRSPTERIPMPVTIHQVAATTWTELAQMPSRTGWTMNFVSPVTFRRGSRFMPWPAPSSVFGSLRSSWRHFGAPHVGDLTLDLKLDPIVVTAVNGHSETAPVALSPRRASGRTSTELDVTGFSGCVSYALDGAADPSAVAALVALAQYAGVGAYTTRGFGGVRDALGRG